MKRNIPQRIEAVKEQMAELEEELASLEKQQRHEISQKFKFPFQKSYRYTTEVTVDLPLPLSKERRTFLLHGQKTFEFSQTDHPGIAGLRVVQDRFTMESASLIVDRFLGFMHKILKVPRTTVHAEAIHHQTVKGYVDLVNGHYSCQFTLRLTPKAIPVLALIGVDDLPLVIRETGRLDFGPKAMISAAGEVEFSSAYQGPLRIRAVYEKDSCPTTVSLCGTVGASQCTKKQIVYIAPGDTVTLWWQSSADVQAARIEPGKIAVPPNGSLAVNPTVTTTYSITADGACSREDSVLVVVFQKGDKFQLVAPYSPEKKFGLEIPPEFCSPRLLADTIQSICNAGCFSDPKFANTVHNVQCGPTWGCHGEWSGMKKTPAATPVLFTTNPGVTPLGGIPLAGQWEFLPRLSLGPFFGAAYFYVTIAID